MKIKVELKVPPNQIVDILRALEVDTISIQVDEGYSQTLPLDHNISSQEAVNSIEKRRKANSKSGKLSETQKENIKTDYHTYGISIAALARKYGVSTTTIDWHLGKRNKHKRMVEINETGDKT